MVRRTLALRESHAYALAVDELTYKLIIIPLMLDGSLTGSLKEYRVSASLHTQQSVTALIMHLWRHS